ncbi:U6 snRNA phosphodiesterase [Drosophila grimshawi]|uniref:U6 snRNA phosphodiesterase n=1 Tax=Drosophila grimshawi TaxID=7222 RepID=B4JFE2_DROGR|nr:U6 snRNA phosphodiesterase [Drosophila grimshawi]EDV93423.1 GH18281 [Drosophila grimshawi]
MSLVNYGSSSNSEGEETEETPAAPVIRKRPALPTAASLLGAKVAKPLVEEDEADDFENAALHGGRIRSFKHERGNWATFVYVSAGDCAEQLEDFQLEAIERLAPQIELHANESLHLSLSKTVVLQYHQIDEFQRSLQQALHCCAGFSSTLHLLSVYTNEERTRTFLAVQLDAAFTSKMSSLLRPVDLVMRDYRLPQFYEKPSFHVSLLWCVGDHQTLLQDKLKELQQLLDDHETLQLAVNEVNCKCGNKDFTYKLK